MGLGRRGVLAVEAPDPVLSLASALGLALAAGTALVVDIEGGVSVGRSFGDLVADGPSSGDLGPGRSGVALISGSGVDDGGRDALVEDLARSWPAVVLRCGPGHWPWPTVPVRPLISGLLAPPPGLTAVWQPLDRMVSPPGNGPVLPPLRRGITRALVSGRAIRSNRWVRAWAGVWELPWA